MASQHTREKVAAGANQRITTTVNRRTTRCERRFQSNGTNAPLVRPVQSAREAPQKFRLSLVDETLNGANTQVTPGAGGSPPAGTGGGRPRGQAPKTPI